MTLKEILETGGGVLLIVLTLVQIAPIKVNPWSVIAAALGRALNKDRSVPRRRKLPSLLPCPL